MYRENVPFFDIRLVERKRASRHPCPAGLDPASHPVKPVGTQRVALNKQRMRLRVKARKDTEYEHVDDYIKPMTWRLVQKNDGFVDQKGRIVQKTVRMMFFLIRGLRD